MSNGIDVTWRSSPDGSIGWCNLCQSPVYSRTDPCATGLHNKKPNSAGLADIPADHPGWDRLLTDVQAAQL